MACPIPKVTRRGARGRASGKPARGFCDDAAAETSGAPGMGENSPAQQREERGHAPFRGGLA